MKKVIVTGANGFIGSALLKTLSEHNVEVYAVIKDENEKIDAIKDLPGVKIVFCELQNINMLPEIIEDREIDACIHLAWAGSFGDSRADYELQLLNSKYALDTVNAISRMGVKRFVCSGTLAEKDVLNYHMDDGATPNAVSIYGIAKLNTQLMTKAQCTKLGIEHIWCYLSNTYGVGNTTNNFVNMAARKILRGERAAFTAGTQTYDFVYITDTAKAIYYAAAQGRANTGYYLGSGSPRRLRDYIGLIRDAIDPNYPLYLGEIPFNGKSLSDDAYSIEKLCAHTEYKASVPFEEGIKITVDWLKTIEEEKK